ncbi:hypothetical protein E2I00_014119 [Balaenoptera physalus]|uniref:Uncharacterized protein n=1 Tax=Balaenoptera physalus TaxID=9770 RepID=A0A6A1Q569_BALPH|nr:hypothetical protein E2I00_014119 [Balaenoptera physalus]
MKSQAFLSKMQYFSAGTVNLTALKTVVILLSRAVSMSWTDNPPLSTELRCPAPVCFFRDSRTLSQGSHMSSSIQLEVQASNVSLDTQAPGGQEAEGGDLTLLCSRGHRNQSGTEAQHSLSADLEIPSVKEHNAGQYYYRADNGHNPIQNKVVNISVRSKFHSYSSQTEISKPRARSHEEIPGDPSDQCYSGMGIHESNAASQILSDKPPLGLLVPISCPVLTFRDPRAQAVMGDMVELCWHSGSYSCEADNGLGAQFSELVPLSISGGLMVPGYRSSIIVNGFILVPYLGFRK